MAPEMNQMVDLFKTSQIYQKWCKLHMVKKIKSSAIVDFTQKTQIGLLKLPNFCF